MTSGFGTGLIYGLESIRYFDLPSDLLGPVQEIIFSGLLIFLLYLLASGVKKSKLVYG
ncbi:MAG: hypothetical protein WCK98_08105 [bacterium]